MKIVWSQDARVAAWMFAKSGCRPMQYDMAVGIEQPDGQLAGGIMFTAYNGSDVEVHYYGPGFLKRRTVRLIMSIALGVFQVNRLTIRTRKASMARGVQKLGAIHEGTVRRLYGPTDEDRHAGQQYAFPREVIERLAGSDAPRTVTAAVQGNSNAPADSMRA